jgi:hypothetical protein
MSETIKLDLCNRSLVSNYLERRISGIKDLSDIVKNNSIYTASATFTNEYLIEWMEKNAVFQAIWDPKKTHI